MLACSCRAQAIERNAAPGSSSRSVRANAHAFTDRPVRLAANRSMFVCVREYACRHAHVPERMCACVHVRMYTCACA
eukprot:6180227-Pleurochrysis_carterae.AAC.1